MSEARPRFVEVVRAGPLTTVQDIGRAGYAHLAVPRSGALDRPALDLANRLVGNHLGDAALEATLGGVGVRAGCDCTVAVTGSRALISVDGHPAGWGLATPVRRGQLVEVGPALSGVRSYLAVDGGLAVQATLGSRSTDVLSSLGPPPLRDGDVLPLGPPRRAAAALDFDPWPEPSDPLVLRARLGPRDDWFTAAALAVLRSSTFTASSLSNRVALRLDGARLERAVEAELPSEGMVLGAVQVPADGRPLVFLADHPTTGGYPVIAVVEADDLPACAQARPGAAVRFHVLADRPGYGARS
jgi:biotin-dependent carboxylase-like uncharacterized protein